MLCMTLKEFLIVIETLLQRTTNAAWHWKNKPLNLPAELDDIWQKYFNLQITICENLNHYINSKNSNEKFNFYHLNKFKYVDFSCGTLENIESNFNYSVNAMKEIVSVLFNGKKNNFDLPIETMSNYFYCFRNGALF